MFKGVTALLVIASLSCFYASADNLNSKTKTKTKRLHGGGEDSGGGTRISKSPKNDLKIKSTKSALNRLNIFMNHKGEVSSLNINFICVLESAPKKDFVLLKYFKPQCNDKGVCNFEGYNFSIKNKELIDSCTTPFTEQGECKGVEKALSLESNKNGGFYFLTNENKSKSLSFCSSIGY